MTTSKSKKFAIRSDMEGLHGVVDYAEVVPGSAGYAWGRERLHAELQALCEGLFEGGADAVEIYDEHYFGRNIDVDKLPSGVAVFRGKPPYRADWAGGVEGSAGLILQGLHAMAGVTGGLLSHTYEPEIETIRINGDLVGEIGVETAIAADCGVPLVLILADSAGVAEAQAFQPGVVGVSVKQSIAFGSGLCPSWETLRPEIVEKARCVAEKVPDVTLRRYPAPAELSIQLKEGAYADALWSIEPKIRTEGNTALLRGEDVTALWARYWQLKLKAQVRVVEFFSKKC